MEVKDDVDAGSLLVALRWECGMRIGARTLDDLAENATGGHDDWISWRVDFRTRKRTLLADGERQLVEKTSRPRPHVGNLSLGSSAVGANVTARMDFTCNLVKYIDIGENKDSDRLFPTSSEGNEASVSYIQAR